MPTIRGAVKFSREEIQKLIADEVANAYGIKVEPTAVWLGLIADAPVPTVEANVHLDDATITDNLF